MTSFISAAATFHVVFSVPRSASKAKSRAAPTIADTAILKLRTALSVGASLKDAAGFIGVPMSVITSRRRTDAGFARDLRQATQQGKVYHLNKISKSAAWQASAWVLERRWRKQFARNGPSDPPVAAAADIYHWDRLTVEQHRQVVGLLQLAHQTRDDTQQGDRRPAADAVADLRRLPAPAAGDDRGGVVPAEPA
jgi:hypothetical protein